MDKGKILTLRSPEVIEDVVDCLAWLLDRARKGEISAIAFVAQSREGWEQGMPGVWKSHMETIGAIERLKHRLNTRLDLGAEEAEF